MRTFTHTQNSNLKQIDMAQIARQSSNAILAFNANQHNQIGFKKTQHKIQNLTNHVLFSGIATFAFIATLAM